MHHPPGHQPRAHSPGHQGPPEQREPHTPGQLSASDPEPERPSRRPPIWLIVIVLLLVGFIALHLAGGPHP
jgi:hypothetical protein